MTMADSPQVEVSIGIGQWYCLWFPVPFFLISSMLTYTTKRVAFLVQAPLHPFALVHEKIQSKKCGPTAYLDCDSSNGLLTAPDSQSLEAYLFCFYSSLLHFFHGQLTFNV